MEKGLPDMTHLQFVVLLSLNNEGEVAGAEIREKLLEVGHETSLAAFYQLMARLEMQGLISGRHVVHVEQSQTIREAVYLLTEKGSENIRAIVDFYRPLLKKFLRRNRK